MFLSILSHMKGPFNANRAHLGKNFETPGILEIFTGIEKNLHLGKVKTSPMRRFDGTSKS